MLAARLLNTTRTSYQMGQSMSDESQFTKPEPGRPLRPEETALIRALLAGFIQQRHLKVRSGTPM